MRRTARSWNARWRSASNGLMRRRRSVRRACGRIFHGRRNAKPDLERTVESLKRVAEYGAAKNVVVNLENDNPVSEDPFFLVKVIEKVDSEWLHALPDFGNSVAAQDDEYAYKGIEGMFGRAYNISHVKETEVGEKGKTAHVDLAKTFGIAKQHGYKGYFSMEWDSPGDPYQGTAGLIEKTLKNFP